MERGNCIVCGKLTRFAFRYDIDCSPIWTHKKCANEARVKMFFELSQELRKDTLGKEYKDYSYDYVEHKHNNN